MMDVSRRQALAVAVALTLGAGTSACNSEPEGTSGEPGRSQAAAAPAQGGGERARAQSVVNGLQADYDAGDAAGYCARLTAAGRAQVEAYGRRYDQGRTCRAVVLASSRFARELGAKQRPSRLLSFEVDGDEAVAMVSKGGARPVRMRFVRRGGEWRIPDPGFDIGYDQATDAKGKPMVGVGEEARLGTP